MARKINDFFFDDDPPVIKNKFKMGQAINLMDEPSEQTFALADDTADQQATIQPEQVIAENNAIVEDQQQGKVIPMPSTKMGQPINTMAETPDEQVQGIISQGQAPPEVVPEKKDHYKTLDEIRAEKEAGYNPLFALMQQNKPELDKKRQERLQRIAAVNSIGKGLGTVLQGYYGQRGATIPEDKSTLLPESYQEYITNQKEHDAKKDIWNKDMLALSMKKQADVDAEMNWIEQSKAADRKIEAQQVFATRQAEVEREYQKEKTILDQDFLREMAKAKTKESQDLVRENYRHDMAKIRAQGAQSMKEIEARGKQTLEQIKAYENAGRYNRGGSSTSVERSSGNETKPLSFFDSKGKQQFIDADQLDVVQQLLDVASSDYSDPKYITNKAMYEKMTADGKISEEEARRVLSGFFDKYYTLVDGKPVPKGNGQQSQQAKQAENGYFD